MNKLKSLFLIGCILLGIGSCTSEQKLDTDGLWAIAFDKASLQIEEGGDPVPLTLNLYPASRTESIRYTVAPEGILSYENGNVTGLAVGSAVITAEAEISKLKATCSVTVLEPFIMDPPTGKKGACFNFTRYADWPTRIFLLKPYWFYCWSPVYPTVNLPENAEWVPIFNNKNQVTDENLAAVKELASKGTALYLLGFNEPDLASQGNMSVEEAIELWPKLEEVDLPLGSPATSNGAEGPKWLENFMNQVKSNGYRVNFICAHWYGGPNLDTFKSYLTTLHDKYRRPIWVTEFGVADYSAQTPESNKYSVDQVLTFLKGALDFLDKTEWIHRYCWFTSASPEHQYTATASPFDINSQLTALGQYYAGFGANDAIVSPHVEPAKENILVNGNFEDGQASWDGTNCDASKVLVYEGTFSGRLLPTAGTMYQTVTINADKTYLLTGFYSWKKPTAAQGIVSDATISIKAESEEGSVIKSITLKGFDDEHWENLSLEFKVPAGTNKVTVFIWKPEKNDDGKNSPALFLDNLEMIKQQGQ